MHTGTDPDCNPLCYSSLTNSYYSILVLERFSVVVVVVVELKKIFFNNFFF